MEIFLILSYYFYFVQISNSRKTRAFNLPYKRLLFLFMALACLSHPGNFANCEQLCFEDRKRRGGKQRRRNACSLKWRRGKRGRQCSLRRNGKPSLARYWKPSSRKSRGRRKRQSCKLSTRKWREQKKGKGKLVTWKKAPAGDSRIFLAKKSPAHKANFYSTMD